MKKTYTFDAPAKINIGLDVLRKRSDGYHDLKMIMQTISLYDTLTFTIDGSAPYKLSMTCSNNTLPTDEDNLVIRAVNCLAKEFNISGELLIHLEKRIPVAAGMAGGSTDAAAAFIAVNDIFGLGLSKEELMKRAVKLGADIPYCIMKNTALSEGIGDILTPIAPLKDAYYLIVKPPINVSTGFVYGNLKITDETVHPDIDGIICAMKENDAKKVGALLGNVLETVTVPAYPVINEIKQTMLDNGATGSLMSGSGPTVFGIYEDEQTAKKACEICKDIYNGCFATVCKTAI